MRYSAGFKWSGFFNNFGMSIDDLKIQRYRKMNDETQAQTKDRFWLYVGCITFALVTTLVLVKKSEDEKFAPIKQQLQDEAALMNIRVLN